MRTLSRQHLCEENGGKRVARIARIARIA